MEQIRKALAGQKTDKARVSLLLQMLGAEIKNSAGDHARSNRLADQLMRLPLGEVFEGGDDDGRKS